MKKFTILILAAVAAVSCTRSYFPDNEIPQGNAISFAGSSAPVTRSAASGDAATQLGGKFTVYGAKSDNNASSMAFDGYKVKWIENSDGTYSWNYVGQQDPADPVQSIKYWDNNTLRYDFVAFSQGGGNAKFSTVDITKIGTDEPIYTISGQPNNDQLYPIYLADITTVEKSNYGKEPVTIKFRPFRTKIRFGIYETIPGYSVTNVNFYHTSNTVKPGGYPAVYSDGKVFPTTGTEDFVYSVYASGTDHRLSVQYEQTDAQSFSGNIAFEYLNYSNGNVLGTSSANASYFIDQYNNEYVNVLPIGDHSAPICIRVDYTLVPLDGSDAHSITVKDATAVIPAEYVRWQPGFAYTYLFKISEESGGLYPITFDAEQYLDSDPFDTETTEIDIPITAYQKGTAMETQGAFSTGNSIYLTVGDYRQLQKAYFDNANYIRLYRAEGTQAITEANVQNCIDNGGIKGHLDGEPNYSITDASGKTLSLTDVTDDLITIQSNFSTGDAPGTGFDDHSNALARIANPGQGTYVFVYSQNAPAKALFNTMATGTDYYTYECVEDNTGNLYYMDYYKSDGTEKYNADALYVRDLLLDPDYCVSGSDYRGYNRTSYSNLFVGLTYYKKVTVDDTEVMWEYIPTNDVSASIFYRTKDAVYFENYNPGYTIRLGEKYWKLVTDASGKVGYMEGTEYPVVITESNKNDYVCAKIYGTMFSEYPFEQASLNNYRLNRDEWYLAVDGLDKFRNDDGSFDDGTQIYMEEYHVDASAWETAQMCIWEQNESGDDGSINMNKSGNNSFRYGLFYDSDGCGTYSPTFFTFDELNTLAPGNYRCRSYIDGVIHKFTATGIETTDYIESKYGSGDGSTKDCFVYPDNGAYKSYIKIINVE